MFVDLRHAEIYEAIDTSAIETLEQVKEQKKKIIYLKIATL